MIIGTKLAVQFMEGESCGGGVIINTSSVAGKAISFSAMFNRVSQDFKNVV